MDKVLGIELGKNIRQRKTILDNWDEIAERLQCGESIDLNTFAPDEGRRLKKNASITKSLEDKKKL